MPSRRLELSSPLDLTGTLSHLRHGPDDPTTRVADGQVWRSTRTPDGPGSQHLRIEGSALVVDAWGPGAGWLLDHVGELVGEHDAPETFPASSHPAVERLWRARPGLRIGRTTAVVEALVPAVLGQRVTVFEARRSFRLLTRAYGEPAPGAVDLFLPPEPGRLAGVPYYDLHRLGIERGRADTIRRIAASAGLLEAATSLTLDEGHQRLTALTGVGPWTAGLVALEAFGDPDAVPVGDLHLPNRVAWLLAGEDTADDARMLELLEPWAGHRARVLQLLDLAMVAPPRHASRARIVDMRYR